MPLPPWELPCAVLQAQCAVPAMAAVGRQLVVNVCCKRLHGLPVRPASLTSCNMMLAALARRQSRNRSVACYCGAPARWLKGIGSTWCSAGDIRLCQGTASPRNAAECSGLWQCSGLQQVRTQRSMAPMPQTCTGHGSSLKLAWPAAKVHACVGITCQTIALTWVVPVKE
jgi:hypothetical protein